MKKGVMLGLASVLFTGLVQAQTIDDGIKALDYENFATAKRIFSKLVKQQPTEAKNYYYLGQAYLALGRTDSARMTFTAGSQADPKSIYNWIGLGRTYLDDNNVQKARENFDKAKSLTSQKDIMLYVLLANAYTNSNHPDCQQSINLLNKAVEYNNKSADVYYELGAANECLNKGGEAVSSYERASELNPSNAKAYTKIGVIWRLARNYNQSLTSFQSALKADANFPPAYRELAELYFYTGQFDKAKETYQKYLDLADKDDYTQFRYAQFLFLTKDYEGAMNILNQLRQKIDQPVLWRLLAYSNYELKNYSEGMSQIKTFFEKTDSSRLLPSDYEYYAKLLSKSGQDSVAIGYLAKAIALDSTKYTLYSDIGGIYFQGKKYHEAAEAYLDKVKANAKEATLQDYFNVGKSYYFSKEFPQSDSAFASMIRLKNDWPIGYLWRARVWTNLDNPDTVKALAAPYYEALIQKAMVDTNKYKKELIEAYKYLGDVNALKENYGAALYYYGKFMSLDPTNTEVPKTIESVRSLYKNTSFSSVTLQKDSDQYIIPVTIGTNTVNFRYDPVVGGLAVTPEGAKVLGGTESGTFKADRVKIADRSVKNVTVTIIPDLKYPNEIGSWILNQANIVVDYATGVLLLR